MGQAGQLRKIAEGREAEIFAWQDGTVLRLLRNPNGQRQLEWEAAAMRAAAGAGVRVPAVREITTVDGRPGLVMERIEGVDMLLLVGKQPWLVFSVGAQSGRIQAGLHEVRAPEEIPPLRVALRGRIERAEPLPEALARFALSVLDELPDGDRICHGDLHPGNIMRTASEPVLIDWTNVTRGDPAADFARTNLMIRLGDVPPGSPLVIRYGAIVARGLMRSSYVRAYRRARPLDMALAARWEIPVMAARMAEGIESENPKLIRLLEKRRKTAEGQA
jgi:aminoglycoside phosphotransferase (APT) family kinase protein